MKINYEQAGVSIAKADTLTALIQKEVKSENIGMFAGIYEHPVLPDYYLVGCTDGVGTKIIPLIKYDLIETVAIDLIAMNLNDMICLGAAPLFFLDYFATHSLDVEITSRFIRTLKNELSKYNCTLLGGETAELNDLVTKKHFDVGGFAVGLVKKDKMLRKENVKEDDIVIGLKSSGPHSNGYTLIRKLHEQGLLTEEELKETLEPTCIYVNEILKLCEGNLIKACAHITGGGIAGNLERVISDGLCAEISVENIPKKPIFKKLEDLVGFEEAYKTFNMGVGMCIIASPDKVKRVIEICKTYEPFILGKIISNIHKKVDLI
ncbi:MAG: phosphoribosylformylglycinamidine cyclo-ligase [Candidatus Melainabacteria bacterium GWA2_34_9]|nr:MAG: phosphoribosylformylglycinamidine cyclo-ligase [Candidatus Melainabacteria bacterium GWA2_34_9]